MIQLNEHIFQMGWNHQPAVDFAGCFFFEFPAEISQ